MSKLHAKIDGKRLIEGLTLDVLESYFQNYYKINRDIIDKYLYLSDRINEFKMRIDPEYKLYILNNKSSGKVINAKVKIGFSENGKSKYSHYNVHIGRLDQYKMGLNDPKIDEIVKNKIRQFLNLKFPANLYDADNQKITLFY